MAAFAFELVAPDRHAFSGPVESVLVPGADGDFLVLSDHMPTMSSIRPGILDITDAAGLDDLIVVAATEMNTDADDAAYVAALKRLL